MTLRFRLPPEIRLLLDTVASSYNAQIPTPDPGIDWAHLPGCARHHRVVPLLQPLLGRPGLLPAPVQAELEGLRKQAVIETLASNAELMQITGALEAAGIEVLALKGAALAAQLYGDPSRRTMRDIDLLVRPSEAGAARAVLAECGYGGRPDLVVTHANALELWHPGRRRPVELHIHLADDDAVLPLRILRPFETAAAVDIGGKRIRTLGLEAATTFAAFHGAKHMWARLFWIADFAAACQSQQVDWAIVSDLADRLGIAAPLESGLRLVEQLLGLPRPERMSVARHAGGAASRVIAAMPEILTVPPVGDQHAVLRRIGTVRGLGLELALHASWRARWATLRARAKPTDVDRRLVKLPAGLGVLYYAVRIARVAGSAAWRAWQRIRRPMPHP